MCATMAGVPVWSEWATIGCSAHLLDWGVDYAFC
jgi:hypothetical protein